MYISAFYIRGKGELAFQLDEYLSSLGYYRAADIETADLIVNIGYLGSLMKTLLRSIYRKVPVIINITRDGEYIIPLTREKTGGAFFASIIADKVGGEVVLTSRSSLMGLYSPEEFAWLNGLYIVNRGNLKVIYRKLEKNAEVKVFYDGVKLKLPKGYVRTEEKREADLLVNVFDPLKLTMYPYLIAVGIMLEEEVSERVVDMSVELTAKSLGVYPERITKRYIVKGRNPVACEDFLRARGYKVILKGTRRAKGVVTCLGISLQGLQPST